MVFNNSFLILEVSPANNELNVSLNKGLTMRFSMDMDVNKINDSTLLLHKVNGDPVATTVTYDRTTRTARIQPNDLLTAGTKYRYTVLGGTSGVSTVTGSTLPESKVYEFTTTGTVSLTAPTSLVVSVAVSKISINWMQPSQYDPLIVPGYKVYVSTSNLDPDADAGAIVWPLATDSVASTITQTAISVGRDLPSGDYYVYVKAVTDKQSGPWASTQVYIAPLVVGGGGSGGGGSTTLFEVRETYPKSDAVHIMPTTVKVLFTSNIDMTTITTNSVYIVKKKKPNQLSLIDLMTEFAPGGITYTVDVGTPANLLSLTVTGTLEKNAEYTIVIRETVKDTLGSSLGEAFFWSFTTTYDPFFGDPEEIKEDVKGFLSNIPDKILYGYMHGVSMDALSTVTSLNTGTRFDSTNAPRYIGQYVRVRAAYDLLVNAYLERSASAGSVRTLGDLTIDNSKSVDVTKILAAFKERIKPLEDELHGLHNRGYAKPHQVVKGEVGAAYPAGFTRTFKDVQV